MSRVSLVVTLDNGETKEVNPNRPLLLLQLERKFGVQRPESHEQMAWMAWQGLGNPGNSLEDWLEGVADIDTKVEKDADVSGEPDPS